MILYADSGSTKTDWLLKDGEKEWVFQTQGINPCLMDVEKISCILKSELLPHLSPMKPRIRLCQFYGAGCTEENQKVIEEALRQVLIDCITEDTKFEIGSDLLGAAKVLCGEKEGIACILGTGSNSCLYDGKQIVGHTPALGYILGDEGSAAYIGKRLIGDLLKGQMSELVCELFFKETGLTMGDIINKVYKEPMPNRFLGVTSQFCQRHLDIEEIREFVIGCFVTFLQRNVINYNRPDLEVNFVGSIAVVYEKELREAAGRCEMKVGKITKAPIDGLNKQ